MMMTGWRALIVALCIFGGLATLLGFFGGAWWPLDLLAHFRLQYAVGMLLVVALAVIVKQRGPGLIAAAIVVVNAALIVPACFGGASDGRPALTILSANVLSSNSDHAAIIAMVRERQPDVFVVLELSRALAAELGEQLPEYTTRELWPRDDNFGIGLLAKVPMATEPIDFDKGGIPSIVATTPELTLIATHPVPPSGGFNADRRDAHLHGVAAKVRSLARPTVVVGDLNTTPWAASFDVLEDVGLEDTRAGFGLQATWPTGFFPLAIPIDHCLVTPTLGAKNREVLDDIGSDHYPIWVELVWTH